MSLRPCVAFRAPSPDAIRAFSLAAALAASLALTGCDAPDVPAHEVEIVVEYDGQRSEARVAFADHDEELEEGHPDSANEGWAHEYVVTRGHVIEGRAPIVYSGLSSLEGGERRFYDVVVQRTEADQAAYVSTAPPHAPQAAGIELQFGPGDLGVAMPCASPSGPCTVTLREM